MSVSDLHGVTVPVEEALEAVDRKVGRSSIRDKQLMPARRLPQHGFQFELRGAGQGNGADFAALALDGQLAGFHRLCCCRGVKSKDLVDAQAAVPRQANCGGIVFTALAPRFADHAVDLFIAPCAVDFAERAPFQTEHRIGRQLGMFAARQLVVEKTDGGEVGFDGGRRTTVFLEEFRVSKNVLGRDVGNAFNVIDFREKIAEAADGLFVSAAGLDTALSAVAKHTLDLGEQVLINGISFHHCTSCASGDRRSSPVCIRTDFRSVSSYRTEGCAFWMRVITLLLPQMRGFLPE